jgi:hypothetical protein
VKKGLASFFILAAMVSSAQEPLPPELLENLDFFQEMDMAEEADFLETLEEAESTEPLPYEGPSETLEGGDKKS